MESRHPPGWIDARNDAEDRGEPDSIQKDAPIDVELRIRDQREPRHPFECDGREQEADDAADDGENDVFDDELRNERARRGAGDAAGGVGGDLQHAAVCLLDP